MSTYNGEKYLREQLDSVFSQTYRNIEILIRDDGSTDSTLSILEEYCSKHNNITFYKGDNLKPAKSFMHLLSQAPIADYYAFCDQDDVWKPEKIETAINKLESISSELPAVYIGTLTYVDKELNIIGRRKDFEYHMTFAESWISCVATGCTMVMNAKLRKLVIGINCDNIEMHDIWAYRICLAYGGQAIYDYTPYILYRQHGNNVIGANTSLRDKWLRRIQSLIHREQGKRWLMSLQMYQCCIDTIPAQERKTLETIVNYKSSLKCKMKMIFGREFQVNDNLQNLIFHSSVLFNRY